MIAVDTSVWIDFFVNRPTPQVEFLAACLDQQWDDVALTDVVLTEILQGLGSDALQSGGLPCCGRAVPPCAPARCDDSPYQ